MLTGWREQEALTLRWDALDFDRSIATLVDTKTGKSQRPLSTSAIVLLKALPRIHGSPYVFPSPVKKSKPLSV